MSHSTPTLSGIVSQFLEEGAELIGGLSDENEETRTTATCALSNWLGRFQIEVSRAAQGEEDRRRDVR
ncbi:hypothetical protein FBQ96_02455 [Nitrospirales bacterium NOB]|nr:hypothetical protein [Nitrospirales bacterium NOB]